MRESTSEFRGGKCRHLRNDTFAADGGSRTGEDEETIAMSTDIANFVNGTHRGEPVALSGVGSLASAVSGDLAFSIHHSRDVLEETDAAAVLCPTDIDRVDGTTQIGVDNPRLAYAKVSTTFFEDGQSESTTAIHPSAVVERGAAIGEGTRIGPHVWIGENVSVGRNCTIRAGTVIGGTGFGYERDSAGRPHRLAHVGSVRIESNVDIGPNCSIDRAVFDETVIRERAKLSGQIHVAHQVSIGEDTLVTCGVGFGGGASVGDRVMIHPHATIAEGVSIADEAEIGMNATVLDDVTAGTTVVGSPARPIQSRSVAPGGQAE